MTVITMCIDVSDIKGYNDFTLSFWLVSCPADQALEWTTLDAATRSSIRASYAAAAVVLIPLQLQIIRLRL